MKSLPRVVLTLVAVIGATSGCGELTQPDLNTAPKVIAGLDVMVPLHSEVELSGYATDAESNIESYSWKKVFGPDSYYIASPNASRTRLDHLQRGRYDFELAVTDKGGLTGKDTVSVFVYDPRTPGVNEVIFRNLAWQCPMGCSVVIDDFHDHVPNGATIKVSVRHDGDSTWVEARPEKQYTAGERFVYGIDEHRLWVYADDASGVADVKVNF